MKSKTLIDKQIKKKTNKELVETIISAKKNDKWLNLAGLISSSRKNLANVNLSKLEAESKEGEILVVPGKVLSQGEISKKIKVVALSFSEAAKEKLLKSGSKVLNILEEIKLNPKAEGIKIIK